MLPLASFTGVFLVSSIILILTIRLPSLSLNSLLLLGFSISTLVHALTSFLISNLLQDRFRVTAILQWMLGGFATANWLHCFIVLIPIFLALFLALPILVPLDLLVFGEEQATALGICVKKLKLKAILLLSLLTGAVISVAGALPFVGLIVPHLTRFFIGPSHRNLVFACFINGASLTMCADILPELCGVRVKSMLVF